jgi:hypothetical protein
MAEPVLSKLRQSDKGKRRRYNWREDASVRGAEVGAANRLNETFHK